jgi:hypothetical protein
MTTTMTTTTKEAPHHASYAAMRERVDAKIAEEVRAGAERPDAWWQAPRCVLGHLLAVHGSECVTCTADRGQR